MTELTGLLGLGLLLGLKHAAEADHVVAVSNIVSQTKSLKKSAMAGVLWGIGHTATLLIAGAIILLLKISVPQKLALGFELPVGILLIVLGVKLIIKTKKERIHIHSHEHHGDQHIHLHSHQNSPSHRHAHPSFWMGLLHGLAGSASIVLLVLSTTNSTLQGLTFILVFGIGSVLGMLIISTLIGVPIIMSKRFNKLDHRLELAAGVASVFVGLLVIYQLLFVEKLFSL